MPKLKPLIPPDPERCQAMSRRGGFLTFGIPDWVRCESKPVVIATESKPDADGRKGSMSLCAEHKEKMVAQLGDGFATFKKIGEGTM